MKKSLHFALLFFALLQTATLAAQERYTVKPGDPNGIRKWYMGRQIAHVMGHYGIDWLERQEREMEENTSQLLKNLAVQPGIVIADIGAGSGYHSTLLSKMVGNGRVYAVDVEPEMIAYLNARIKLEGNKNIIPVLSTEKKVSLPANSIDMMLLVDVYHEFSFPYEMALSMLEALKPGGKLVLVEFRAEDTNVPIKTIHKMGEQQAVKEFKAAGFSFEKNISNLPWQHCLIFRKPKK
ncbi:MAG: class I SAM-dependent methyltransferase [Bacteroidetes bacterium]|nr:class I SAM-dependent methyltransferase [Bacteroidota bacterium]MDA1122030.1 class I SAM-dependent methyltransferase [Bacteroidota bacterium]